MSAIRNELPDFLKEASPETMMDHLVCFDPVRPKKISHLLGIPFHRLSECVNNAMMEEAEYLWPMESISDNGLQSICTRLGYKVDQIASWKGGLSRANFEKAIRKKGGSVTLRLMNLTPEKASDVVDIVQPPPLFIVAEHPAVNVKRTFDDALLRSKCEEEELCAEILRRKKDLRQRNKNLQEMKQLWNQQVLTCQELMCQEQKAFAVEMCRKKQAFEKEEHSSKDTMQKERFWNPFRFSWF
jgi:hypothetical protein